MSSLFFVLQTKMRRSAAPSKRLHEHVEKKSSKTNQEILAMLETSNVLPCEPELPLSVLSVPHNPPSRAFSSPLTKPNPVLGSMNVGSKPVPTCLKPAPVSRFSPVTPAPSLNDNSSSSKYFCCVWCKKSGRKHKKWEGDGFAKVW